SGSGLIDQLFSDDDQINQMRSAARERFQSQFTWGQILREYEDLLVNWL
ncbi:MAG: hypothetical protein RL210_1032, partial [Pseudomonadota bacterium]